MMCCKLLDSLSGLKTTNQLFNVSAGERRLRKKPLKCSWRFARSIKDFGAVALGDL
jgi:hypothetical protein